jgi:SAM-dependent methyltransferase
VKLPSLTDVVGYLGHRVHVVRRREAGTLLRWLSPGLAGCRLLDVAAGDGYWAGQGAIQGARAVALDIDTRKMSRGARYTTRPHLVLGDALRLPFRGEVFDAVMSVCAIEHFSNGSQALQEMARVLRPGGDLVLSADCLSRASLWPLLAEGHRRRYRVHRTYAAEDLRVMMGTCGLEVLRHEYLFRDARAERLYLELSRYRYAWNLAAPLDPVVRNWDRKAPNDSGSVVLIHARRRGEASTLAKPRSRVAALDQS